MRKKEIWTIVLLAAINFTHILDFMIMMPLGNYLMPFFDITPRQFSFLVGAYPITAFFSGFAAAFFVDKHDRKRVLVFAYIGFFNWHTRLRHSHYLRVIACVENIDRIVWWSYRRPGLIYRC